MEENFHRRDAEGAEKKKSFHRKGAKGARIITQPITKHINPAFAGSLTANF
jgi:hypothetical protein